jgi:hypothetical protein
MYKTVSMNFLINSIQKKVDKKLQERKELTQALENHCGATWNPERINTEYHASRVNPLKYYLKQYDVEESYDSDNEPELELETSEQELSILKKFTLIPNS